MKRLLVVLAAALIATAAQAQNVQYPTAQGRLTAPGYMDMCLSSTGVAVPFALCDTAPGVSSPFRPAAPEQRGRVVTISPNSGAPNGFPANALPTTAVGTGTTGAVTATMAAVVGKTNFICTAQVSAVGGTATIAPVTLTGLKGGNTLTYQVASTAAGNFMVVQFSPCMPASATNTAIAMATTADGTASGVDVNLVGYVQ